MNEYEVLQSVLGDYKGKSYETLAALADETALSHPELPMHSVLTLLKTVQADGGLEFSLVFQGWITQEEAKQREALRLREYEKLLLSMPELGAAERQDMLEHMQSMALYTVAHDSNPDLLATSGFTFQFGMQADGTLIEDEFARSQAAEDEIVEKAEWFGTTGLDDATERSLPRYLRLEFGESILDEYALQARDLNYLGVLELTEPERHAGSFPEETCRVHFWSIPTGNIPPLYGYVEEARDGSLCLGLGPYFPKAGRLKMPAVLTSVPELPDAGKLPKRNPPSF